MYLQKLISNKKLRKKNYLMSWRSLTKRAGSVPKCHGSGTLTNKASCKAGMSPRSGVPTKSQLSYKKKTWMKKNFIYLWHISDITHTCRWRAQRARIRDKPKGFLHLAEPPWAALERLLWENDGCDRHQGTEASPRRGPLYQSLHFQVSLLLTTLP